MQPSRIRSQFNAWSGHRGSSYEIDSEPTLGTIKNVASERFKRIVVLTGLVAVATIFVTGFYALCEKNANSTPVTEPTPQLPQPPIADQEQNTIRALQRQWEAVSAQIPFSPSNRQWTLDTVQFIGRQRMLIQFEDGHEVHAAIVDYRDSAYKIAKAFKSEPDFTRLKWRDLVKKFGSPRYLISTYTYDSAARRFTKSSTNVFVGD